MQLSNAPAKFTLPFANSGSKNTIPVASQIGITPGAASFVDGFPPLTFTPVAAGGVPPAGKDFNGLFNELTALGVFLSAGGIFLWDATFAADANAGGYPHGALVLSTDEGGLWKSTIDNNTVNPESDTTGKWLPMGFSDFSSVAMVSANVTLTNLQAARPIIIITGTLTTNLNLVFPTWIKEWRIINNATGVFAVTCKTASGTGIAVNTGDSKLIYGDGTNILDARFVGQQAFQQDLYSYAQATGTADALVAAFTPAITLQTLGEGIVTVTIMPTAANATTTPTFTPNNGVITAANIVKGNNQALAVGDIAGANHPIILMKTPAATVWTLLNPATGVTTANSQTIQGAFKNLQSSSTGLSATVLDSADEIVVESATNAYVTLRNVSITEALTTSGANGLDNTAPQTVTITIASPGVVILNGHGFPANAPVVLSTTGALPTGLAAATTHYVTSPTTNTFQLSATKGGSAINTSGTQSGVQSIASVLAASSWYSKWVIYNGTTVAGLLSSSATNPVLPSGYTYKARTGWVYTDGTANKFPLSYSQLDADVQYKPAAGSNVTSAPQMATGAAGNVSTPTWVALGVGSFVPPTASRIRGINISPGASQTIVAPNNAYGAYNSSTNPPFMSNAVTSGNFLALPFDMGLESTNIYWAASGTGCAVAVTGWKDNL